MGLKLVHCNLLLKCKSFLGLGLGLPRAVGKFEDRRVLGSCVVDQRKSR